MTVGARSKDSAGIVYLLKRAELAVRSCCEVVLAPLGLTPTQFLVLFELKQNEGISSAELARAAGVRAQSMGELIAALEREGLITRREAPEHRRILRIKPSPAGEQLLARGLRVAKDLERELLSGLTAAEVAHLHTGLTKLLASARAHDTHPSLSPARMLGPGRKRLLRLAGATQEKRGAHAWTRSNSVQPVKQTRS